MGARPYCSGGAAKNQLCEIFGVVQIFDFFNTIGTFRT
jgi:hypothetical protein